MHPVNYLFDEINRNHWGIPQSQTRPARKHEDVPAWRRLWRGPRDQKRS